MAKIANPVTKGNYTIEINGYDVATAQKVTIGKTEITEAVYGDGNRDIAIADRVKFPDLVVEKLVAQDVPDKFFWDKLQSAANASTGQNGLPSTVEESFFIKLFAGDKVTVVRKWLVTGWVKSVEEDVLGDKEEGLFMEKATYRVNLLERIV